MSRTIEYDTCTRDLPPPCWRSLLSGVFTETNAHPNLWIYHRTLVRQRVLRLSGVRGSLQQTVMLIKDGESMRREGSTNSPGEDAPRGDITLGLSNILSRIPVDYLIRW
jgi:hypothetical protein